ncbi:AraC family transcriptional regulator ligand-binding domain-containing protein [Bradyrhizobium sp. ORS 3257]|uniref:AraC family transcriptional regulator ligand-binding domain-containing protein n=1 Tax=Bradyrhizobium vignae TaxID=1549949 RepID=UPI000F0005DA
MRVPLSSSATVALAGLSPVLEAYRAADRPEAGIDLGLAISAASHGLVGLFALSSDTLWDAMVTTSHRSRRSAPSTRGPRLASR